MFKSQTIINFFFLYNLSSAAAQVGTAKWSVTENKKRLAPLTPTHLVIITYHAKPVFIGPFRLNISLYPFASYTEVCLVIVCLMSSHFVHMFSFVEMVDSTVNIISSTDYL